MQSTDKECGLSQKEQPWNLGWVVSMGWVVSGADERKDYFGEGSRFQELHRGSLLGVLLQNHGACGCTI